jgi:uncharacterized protein
MSKLAITALPTETLENMAGILTKYPVTAAYLYGSLAEGRATKFSDLDLALLLHQEAVRPETGFLRLELEIAAEIAAACHVPDPDVRVINLAPLLFQGEVLTRGKLIYCSDHEARVDFETLTRSLYFDFRPTADMIRETYFENILQRGFHGQSIESRKSDPVTPGKPG